MKTFFRILPALLLLAACGENHPPVAYEIVNTGQVAKGLAAPLSLLDSVVQQGVPEKVATLAFERYDHFRARVRNTRYITMIDFSQHSGAKRFYIVDRTAGTVESTMTAHGTNSDPDKDGFAQYFSNTPNSKMSSLGSYIVAERYVGKHGPSLRMDGLESTNSNVRARAIVLHPAKYVMDDKTKQGWSWGCPAVPQAWIGEIIDKLRDGSFMYAYGINQHRPTLRDVIMDQMVNWPGYQWTDESEAAPDDGELQD
jgi:hypothetical protein